MLRSLSRISPLPRYPHPLQPSTPSLHSSVVSTPAFPFLNLMSRLACSRIRQSTGFNMKPASTQCVRCVYSAGLYGAVNISIYKYMDTDIYPCTCWGFVKRKGDRQEKRPYTVRGEYCRITIAITIGAVAAPTTVNIYLPLCVYVYIYIPREIILYLFSVRVYTSLLSFAPAQLSVKTYIVACRSSNIRMISRKCIINPLPTSSPGSSFPPPPCLCNSLPAATTGLDR